MNFCHVECCEYIVITKVLIITIIIVGRHEGQC